MAITALQLKAVITADTEQAKSGLRGIKSEAESAAGSGGGGIKGLIGSIAGIATGLGVFTLASQGVGLLVDQVKDAITSAQQYQQTQAQTAAVLKSTHDASGQTAEGIAHLAETLQTVTPFSRDATQQAENMLLTFTNIKGNLPAVTQTTLDFATAMHMDATSAALQLGKALNDPATGYTKLQREGVTFTASQVATIKQMEASGNMAGAQSVMLKELQKEFGGSAKAAGSTFAGALAIAQNQLEDTKQKVGTALLPVLASLLKAITPLITALSNGLSAVLPQVTAGLTNLLAPLTSGKSGIGDMSKVANDLGNFLKANVLPIVKELGVVFVTDVLPALAQVWHSIATNLLPALEKLWSKLAPAIVPELQLLGSILKNVVGPALSDAIQIISWLIDKLADLLGALQPVMDLMGKLETFVANGLGGVGNLLSSFHIPGFAAGTDSAPGGPAIVGEDGPELLNLPQGTRVTPARNLPTSSAPLAGSLGPAFATSAVGAPMNLIITVDGQVLGRIATKYTPGNVRHTAAVRGM